MWTGLDRNKDARMTEARGIYSTLLGLINSGRTDLVALAERINHMLTAGIEPNPHDLNCAELHIDGMLNGPEKDT